MHGLIRDRLEEFLGCGPGRNLPLDFDRHLHKCDECREEVSWMQEQSRLLRSLAAPREIDPAPGFYARVMNRIERQQVSPFWAAFLDPAFGRRLSAAALAVVALIFSFLVFTDAQRRPEMAAADAIVTTQHPPLGVDRNQDRETVFVTLATWKE